jgi:hypothetical protein
MEKVAKIMHGTINCEWSSYRSRLRLDLRLTTGVGASPLPGNSHLAMTPSQEELIIIGYKGCQLQSLTRPS